MTTHRVRIGACLGAAICLLALAGCGKPQEQTGQAGHALDNTEFAFLAGAGVIPQDQKYVFTATQSLLASCMHKQGFRYYPAQEAPESEEAHANNELTPNGQAPNEATQLEIRERSGYGIYETFASPSTGSDEGTPPNDLYVRSMSPTEQKHYMEALEGGPHDRGKAHAPTGASYTYVDGGCLAKVETKLYGSAANANAVIETPQDIRSQLVASTEADPTIVKRFAAWSSCMKRRTGRHFAGPNAVASWLEARYSEAGISRQLRHLEIRLAVADTKCGYATHLAQDYSAVFRRKANHLPGSLEGALLSLLEVDERATRRAESLVSSSGQQ